MKPDCNCETCECWVGFKRCPNKAVWRFQGKRGAYCVCEEHGQLTIHLGVNE